MRKIKEMNLLVKILVCLTFFNVTVSVGQPQYERLYNDILKGNSTYSYKEIFKFSKSNNAYNFIAIGYFINANNIMYKKTKDKKYLEYNITVIESMILKNNKANYIKNKWVMNVSSKNQNSVVNGKEHLISEGYFFRYLGEFLDILKKDKIYTEYHTTILESLVYSFNKWEDKSKSSLFHQRFHIGANWAVVSLYLDKFTNEQKYKDFYKTFDSQLKKALTKIILNGKECYVWNSTYPEKFTKSLKNLKKYPTKIQDVTHGNHVVNYIITSYNLNIGVWNREDLSTFGNTVKYIIWNSQTKSFSDNVDGTQSANGETKTTGWKQSDGWMKLVPYNKSIKNIYELYYKENKEKINKSSLCLQYLANLHN